MHVCIVLLISPCACHGHLGVFPADVHTRVFVTNKEPRSWCRAKLGQGPSPAPVWVGNIIARILLWLGPKGLEFGRYSIDYHYTRNFLYVMRNMGAERAQRHIPEFARRLVQQYDKDGAVSNRWGERSLVGSR
jgi:hypothetical protein